MGVETRAAIRPGEHLAEELKDIGVSCKSMYLTGQLGPRRGGCPTKMVVRSLHGGLSEAPSPLMWARLIVLRQPAIEVGLQLGDRPVQGFAERHAIELVEHRFVEPLANTICLRALRFGA